MSGDSDALMRMSAIELAGAIARGDVSAVEAVEASIERIEAVNPSINAVVVKRYDAARAAARAADERRAQGEPLGPLHGVPITVKECLDLEGTPSTFGLPSRKDILATADDPYVARMRQAGAIVVGKTNAAQLLLSIETDNPLYGRTRNPWNPARTPGGSSGGQAAIIAAGASPLGLATDIGGSIRTPASFCGIVGLKPTAGRMPDFGRFSVPLGQRAIVSQVGALARRVDDLALAIQIINDGSSPASEPPRPLGDPATVDLARLRVAWYTDDGTFDPAPAVRRAVTEAVAALAGQGAQVTQWRPPDVPHALDLAVGVLSADGGRSYVETLGRDKREPSIAQLMLLARRSRPTLAMLGGLLRLLGQRRTARVLRNFGHRDTQHYWRLVEAQMAYQDRFRQALDDDAGGSVDVIVCPANPLPALHHGASRDLVTAGAYSMLYNVLGYPAGVVPMTRVRPGEESDRRGSVDLMERAARRTERGSAGLPIGVQIVARPWREHVALAAMRAVEHAARAQPDFPDLAAQTV